MNEDENRVGLDEAASGVASEGDASQQPIEQAESNRQKMLKRTRDRNRDRNFADDDDEALFGALGEDADADAEELGKYRQREKDMDDFLYQNPRGASLLASMQRDGNPVGQLVEDYGEDMVASMSDPEVRKTIVAAEQRRLDKIAKDQEFEQQAQQNLEKSKQARQQLIDDGYDEEQVDEAIKAVIDRAVRNLMSDISRDDIMAYLNEQNRDNDLAEAEQRGEVRGRNANIGSQMERRKRQSDGLPNIGQGAQRQQRKEEDNTGTLGQLAGRKSVWD